jgi:Tol biopolymer transport system component
MYRPSFSADGRRLAAVCPTEGGSTFGLFVIDFATGQVTGPLKTDAEPVGDTSWRGNDEIIFLQRHSQDGPKQMYSIASSGDPATLHQLSPRPASRPDWCAGHGTLFIENTSGSKKPGPVGVVTDQGELRTLPFGNDIMSATWSPDCRRIALTRSDDVSKLASLFIVNADGTGTPTEIPLPGAEAANQPAWGYR